MDKQTLLITIKEAIDRGDLTQADILPLLPHANGLAGRNINITKTLYGIGGIIVLAGIIFLIQQMWGLFTPTAQIATTLGSSLALYVAAVLIRQNRQYHVLANLFFAMAAIVMPIGIFVTLYHFLPGSSTWFSQLIISILPAAVFAISYRLWKEPLLFLLGLLFSTWSLYALLGLMLDQAPAGYNFEGELWSYLTLAVGISYGYIAHYTEQTAKKSLTSSLYFLASAASLGAGYALTFFQDPWIIIYFLLILATIYLSTLLRRRSLLLFGALGLIIHLTRISFEYFADSLGWPLALIISGFIIIGVGYGTYHLNQHLKPSPNA